MAKKRPSFRGRSKSGSKSSRMNPQNMMSQMQEMQEQMARQQEALENEMISVTAGGGAITVEISGHQRIKSIEIEPDLIDPEDQEMLQDMLVAAMNQAIEQSQAVAAQKMEGVTGSVPGLNDMLGGLGGLF